MDQEIREPEAILDTDRLLDEIFEKLAKREFSEVHFDPFQGGMRIRYRKGRDLVDYLTLSDRKAGASDQGSESVTELINTRLKSLSNLDVEERTIPSDGIIHLSFPHLNEDLDLWLTTNPTLFGEQSFVRIFRLGTPFKKFENLGLDPFAEKQLTEAIWKKGGLIVFAGPTNAGKTTTQNSILYILNDSKKNILTAEWPVEYPMSGINQVDCKFEIGYTDTVAVNTFLKQKPDIIKLKLEDHETTRLAFRAASKKTLVLSAIHVHSAASVFDRLRNMGISQFDLSTYIFLIQAQRIIRRLCLDCREAYSPSDGLLRHLKVDEQLFERLGLPFEYPGSITFYKPRGCSKCFGSGYYDRILICESLKVTPKLQDIILNKYSVREIEKTAIEEGMLTLWDAGLRQAILGNTSIEEFMMFGKRPSHA